MSSEQNLPSVDSLSANATLVSELDLETIAILIEDAKAASKRATAVSRLLQEEVLERLKAQINEAYLAKGDDTGSIKVQAEGCEVAINRPKKVEWDENALWKLYAKIMVAGDDPKEYFDTTITVSESRYQAWPASIQSQFEEARTVKIGSVSVKVSAQ